MKPRPDDNEFNTPEEMMVRATFLICLASFTAGIVLLLAGAFAHEIRLVAAGALSLVISALTRSWLKRNGGFEGVEQAEQTFENAVQAAQSPHDARIAELVRLLQLWEELEKKRGSPGFDPWAVHAVRLDIRQMVEADPALDRLFHRSRRAA
jgi:hypothetical protein